MFQARFMQLVIQVIEMLAAVTAGKPLEDNLPLIGSFNILRNHPRSIASCLLVAYINWYSLGWVDNFVVKLERWASTTVFWRQERDQGLPL